MCKVIFAEWVMVGLSDERVDEIRLKMQTFKENGLDPVKAVSNTADGPDLLKYFLDNEGIKLFADNVKDSSQYTLLEKIFEFLYNVFGAEYKVYDINALDQRGQGVLHNLYASSEMVKEVVDKFDADINIKNKYGETVLMKAAEYGRGDSVEYLMSNGANVSITDNKDKNLLHKLAEQFKERDRDGQLKTIELLGESGDLGRLLAQKDKDGKTPLDYARENEKAPELVELFQKVEQHKALGTHTSKIESERHNHSSEKQHTR
jgi:hypothetical protein